MSESRDQRNLSRLERKLEAAKRESEALENAVASLAPQENLTTTERRLLIKEKQSRELREQRHLELHAQQEKARQKQDDIDRREVTRNRWRRALDGVSKKIETGSPSPPPGATPNLGVPPGPSPRAISAGRARGVRGRRGSVSLVAPPPEIAELGAATTTALPALSESPIKENTSPQSFGEVANGKEDSNDDEVIANDSGESDKDEAMEVEEERKEGKKIEEKRLEEEKEEDGLKKEEEDEGEIFNKEKDDRLEKEEEKIIEDEEEEERLKKEEKEKEEVLKKEEEKEVRLRKEKEEEERLQKRREKEEERLKKEKEEEEERLEREEEERLKRGKEEERLKKEEEEMLEREKEEERLKKEEEEEILKRGKEEKRLKKEEEERLKREKEEDRMKKEEEEEMLKKEEEEMLEREKEEERLKKEEEERLEREEEERLKREKEEERLKKEEEEERLKREKEEERLKDEKEEKRLKKEKEEERLIKEKEEERLIKEKEEERLRRIELEMEEEKGSEIEKKDENKLARETEVNRETEQLKIEESKKKQGNNEGIGEGQREEEEKKRREEEGKTNERKKAKANDDSKDRKQKETVRTIEDKEKRKLEKEKREEEKTKKLIEKEEVRKKKNEEKLNEERQKNQRKREEEQLRRWEGKLRKETDRKRKDEERKNQKEALKMEEKSKEKQKKNEQTSEERDEVEKRREEKKKLGVEDENSNDLQKVTEVRPRLTSSSVRTNSVKPPRPNSTQNRSASQTPATPHTRQNSHNDTPQTELDAPLDEIKCNADAMAEYVTRISSTSAKAKREYARRRLASASMRADEMTPIASSEKPILALSNHEEETEKAVPNKWGMVRNYGANVDPQQAFKKNTPLSPSQGRPTRITNQRQLEMSPPSEPLDQERILREQRIRQRLEEEKQARAIYDTSHFPNMASRGPLRMPVPPVAGKFETLADYSPTIPRPTVMRIPNVAQVEWDLAEEIPLTEVSSKEDIHLLHKNRNLSRSSLGSNSSRAKRQAPGKILSSPTGSPNTPASPVSALSPRVSPLQQPTENVARMHGTSSFEALTEKSESDDEAFCVEETTPASPPIVPHLKLPTIAGGSSSSITSKISLQSKHSSPLSLPRIPSTFSSRGNLITHSPSISVVTYTSQDLSVDQPGASASLLPASSLGISSIAPPRHTISPRGPASVVVQHSKKTVEAQDTPRCLLRPTPPVAPRISPRTNPLTRSDDPSAPSAVGAVMISYT